MLGPVVRRLSERDRRILMPCFFQKRAQQEIADDIGLTFRTSGLRFRPRSGRFSLGGRRWRGRGGGRGPGVVAGAQVWFEGLDDLIPVDPRRTEQPPTECLPRAPRASQPDAREGSAVPTAFRRSRGRPALRVRLVRGADVCHVRVRAERMLPQEFGRGTASLVATLAHAPCG